MAGGLNDQAGLNVFDHIGWGLTLALVVFIFGVIVGKEHQGAEGSIFAVWVLIIVISFLLSVGYDIGKKDIEDD